MNSKLLPLLIAFATLFTACSKHDEASSGGTYTAIGVIQKMDTPRITIAHEDIPGYMPAMTMVFELEDPEIAKGLSINDSIKFTFHPTGSGKFLIKSIEKTKPSNPDR